MTEEPEAEAQTARHGTAAEGHIWLIAYSPDRVEEKMLPSIEAALLYLDAPGVKWLNMDSLPSPAALETLGIHLRLHPLALEDVLHTRQRPKLESYGTHDFMVLRMVSVAGEAQFEQVSVFFGHGYVVTIQEGRAGDVFEPVRQRIRRGGLIRSQDSEYLVYALLDALVDALFPVMDSFGERLAELEERVLTQPDCSLMQDVHRVRRQLLQVHRVLGPTRDVIHALWRRQDGRPLDAASLHLRDCYDHILRVADTLESYREMAAAILDIYLMNISNRLNEVMKVLTMIATIFIPLSFLASVYGMNFAREHKWNMPELGWPFGYLLFWVVCICIGIGLLVWFRRRRWL